MRNWGGSKLSRHAYAPRDSPPSHTLLDQNLDPRVDNLTDEHVAQLNNTKKLSTVLDANQFKVGPETKRKILINIYNFTPPLTIKVMFPKVILTRGIFTVKLLLSTFQVTVMQHTRRSLWFGIISDYFWNTFLRLPFLQELYKTEPRTIQLLSSQSND